MTFETVLAEISKQASNVPPLGARLMFQLDEHTLMIDGTGESNVVSTEPGEAQTTIITSLETLIKLKNGELNPMMAVMGGKVKIKGDMGLAMKLQSLL